MRFFTICAKNYIGKANTLGAQLLRFHPDASFTIFLADKQIGLDLDLVPFRLVPIDRLGLIDELGMIKRYNITELSTAVKPSCFSYLFAESDEPAIYLDPDIFVAGPLTEVASALADNDAVLTPHILRPSAEYAFPTENFLRLGMYNLGFLALANSPDTNRFLEWWSRQLETDCVIDLKRGVFVDQKWADFIPSFIERCHVLRHPGYNVAYWNIGNRKLTRASGQVLVNGRPLSFIHFSGLPEDPKSPFISEQMNGVTTQTHPLLGELAAEYRNLLFENNNGAFAPLQYSYFLSPRSARNEHRPNLIGTEGPADRRLARYLLTSAFAEKSDYSTSQINETPRQSLAEEAETNLVDLNETMGPEILTGQGATRDARALVHMFTQELFPVHSDLILLQAGAGELRTLLFPEFPCLDTAETTSPVRRYRFVLHNRSISNESAVHAEQSLVAGGFFVSLPTEDPWADLLLLQHAGFHNPLAVQHRSDEFGYVGSSRFVLISQKAEIS